LQPDGFNIEATYGIDCAQPRSHRPLGVVLMRLRVAEIHQDAVVHVPGDKTAGSRDHFGDSAVIRGDDLAQILGIESRRECSRADQITKHHGQLPAFGNGVIRDFPGLCPWLLGIVIAQRGDCREQLATMTDEVDSEISKVVGRQLRQHRGVYGIVTKRLLVLFETQAPEPRRYVH
jgi:hypothetical protein